MLVQRVIRWLGRGNFSGLIFMAARVLGQFDHPGCRCSGVTKIFLARTVSLKYKDKDLTPSLAISPHIYYTPSSTNLWFSENRNSMGLKHSSPDLDETDQCRQQQWAEFQHLHLYCTVMVKRCIRLNSNIPWLKHSSINERGSNKYIYPPSLHTKYPFHTSIQRLR